MNASDLSNDEQAKLWNGVAGHAWVDSQVVLDQLFKPIEDQLVDAVVAASAVKVLDVGCGTGSTTLAVAHRLGARGRCTGIDISTPMIALAQRRAGPDRCTATFILADAQTHDFGSPSFDMIISRFGVMFFDDPVRAFRNLRGVANDQCKLQMVAWRSAAENSFMTTAERAVATQLPNLPVRQPDAPGQFAFADKNRVRRILDESGWASIDIQPIDVVCTMPEKDLIDYLTRLGPMGRILYEADEQTRTQIIETMRTAFEPFVVGAEVSFVAACWMVCAEAPAVLHADASNI